MTRVSIFSIFVVLLLTLAFLAVVPQTGAANSQPLDRRFLGLWEGVDVNDGSPRIISITDGDADGVFEVVSHDSYWTLCQGATPHGTSLQPITLHRID